MVVLTTAILAAPGDFTPMKSELSPKKLFQELEVEVHEEKMSKLMNSVDDQNSNYALKKLLERWHGKVMDHIRKLQNADMSRKVTFFEQRFFV